MQHPTLPHDHSKHRSPSLSDAIFGERSLTKIAGVFRSEREARQAEARVLGEATLAPAQVRVLGPQAARHAHRDEFSDAVEPEEEGVGRTLLRAHVVLGLAGMMLGLAVHLGFVLAGNEAVIASANASMIMMGFIGLMLGFMLGGAVALRPDHAGVIVALREALENGRWVVVTHPLNAAETDSAARSLQPGSQQLLRTL